jgi:hypothetical protein
MEADPTVGEFAEWVRTDEAGRFSVEGLVPGLRYSLHVESEGAMFGKSLVFKDVTLEPGETRDLGDLRAK